MPFLPEPCGPAFALSEGYDAGLSYQRMRSRALDRPGRGLRTIKGSDPTFVERVRPYTRLSDLTAASHATAARLWGIPVPPWMESDESIHVSRPLRVAQTRRPGVTGHNARLLENDIVDVDGLALTSPAWTWVDLAEEIRLEDLVAAGDALLRRPDAPARNGGLALPDPLSSVAEIERVVTRRRGTRGIRLAREALPLLRSGADSAPESRLRLLIVQAGLPEPEVNRWITDDDGRRISRPDLQYRELRIAMEYEGEHHLTDPAQWTRDIERDDRLRALGWRILRFTKVHLRPESHEATVRRVRAAVRASSR